MPHTPGPGARDTVVDLFDRGRAANSARRPAEAERLLRRALADLGALDRTTVEGFPSVAGGDADVDEARVRVLLSLSTSLVEGQGPSASIRTATEALAEAGRCPPEVRKALVAMCHSQLAMLHGRAGRTARALAELDLAAAGQEALGPRERFVILLSRGMLRLDVPDADGAGADFAAAATLAADNGLLRQEFMARHNLGLTAALAGDLPRALALMLEAERLPADVERGTAWHARASVLLEAGLVEEAVELLEASTADALASGQRLQAAQSLVDLTYGQLLLGVPAAALDAAERAARALDRGMAPGLRRRAALLQLRARLRGDADPAPVVARCATLAQEFDEDGDHVAADLARLLAAEAQTRRGRHTEAVELLDRSGDMARVGSLSTRLRARGVLAAAAGAEGDVRRARHLVCLALRDLAGAVGASASLELRTVTVVQAADLAALDLALSGRAASARLAAVERWRDVAWRAPQVRPPTDPDLARQVTVLRHLRQQVRDDYGQAGRLRERLRSLERQVSSASWSATGSGGPAAVRVPLAQVRAELAAQDATAVCLVEEGERLAAAVLGGRRTRWVEVGEASEVEEAVRRMSADLEASTRISGGPLLATVEAALARSTARVDELVLRPLGLGTGASGVGGGTSGAGRLVIVPTPGLAAVAWGMLPSRSGRPTTVAPSLGTWVRGTRTVAAPRVGLVAGPGVPGALEECGAVGATWQAAVPQGLGGSEDLARALGDVDLVHVAAHGSHRPDSPLFSSVWLDDGPTFLADLERTARVASHVVVSACDTGRTRARGGATTLGLASGLLSLGVASVVAAPCRVPDRTAAALMPGYHRLLAAGLPVDEALARAAADCDLPLAGAFVAWGSPWSVTAS